VQGESVGSRKGAVYAAQSGWGKRMVKTGETGGVESMEEVGGEGSSS
jgi:hypothetical protein